MQATAADPAAAIV